MKEKKMSVMTKVIGIIALIALISAVVVLVVILTTGNNKPINPSNNNPNNNQGEVKEEIKDLLSAVKKLPEKKALDFIFTKLDGYWTFNSKQFVGLTVKNTEHNVDYGLKETSFWVRGKVTEATISGENSFYLTILIPAVEASEINDAEPERTEKIYFDVSNFHLDNRINVKIANLGDGNWHTYEYGGKTLEEAFK